MEFSVIKLRCADCGTVFYSGPEDENWEKCPMTFCEDGYGYEVDEITYDISINKTAGEVIIEQRVPPDDIVRIK